MIGIGMGRGGGCGSSATFIVDFHDNVQKLDPCRDEIFANFGCFGAVGAFGFGRGRRGKPVANFNGFWSAGFEVIGGYVSLALQPAL